MKKKIRVSGFNANKGALKMAKNGHKKGTRAESMRRSARRGESRYMRAHSKRLASKTTEAAKNRLHNEDAKRH